MLYTVIYIYVIYRYFSNIIFLCIIYAYVIYTLPHVWQFVAIIKINKYRQMCFLLKYIIYCYSYHTVQTEELSVFLADKMLCSTN